MQNIIDRFYLIMKFRNWKQKDLAAAMKIAPASVSLIFKNKTNPSYESLKNLLHNNPEISAAWLISGSGSMLSNNQTTRSIPIIGEIAAGNPIDFVEFKHNLSISLPFATDFPTQYHALKVFGDSMAPAIIHNDVVILHSVFDPWDLDGKVVACRIDTETTLKQLIIDHENRQSILMPFNSKHYKPIVLNEDSPYTQIIGYLVALIRYP